MLILLSTLKKEEKSCNNYGPRSSWRNTFIVDDERIYGLPNRRLESSTRTEREIYIQACADVKS